MHKCLGVVGNKISKMFGGKDLRRRHKHEKAKDRFKKHKPRTMKDRRGPRVAPAENRSMISTKTVEERVEMANETIGETWPDPDGPTMANMTTADAAKDTVYYSPEMLAKLVDNNIEQPYDETTYEVELESTIDATCRFAPIYTDDDQSVTVLNFASAKNPGGGFLNGTMGQEESLAFCSGLYHCIKDQPMYALNKTDPLHGLYHNAMIYSPGVPIIRQSDGDFLSRPCFANILTAPAVNWGQAEAKKEGRANIESAVLQRMDSMMAVAAANNTHTLVLGSWGCGVFKGDINFVAHQFVSLLTTKYDRAFQCVCFSTLDATHKAVFERELDNKLQQM